MRFLFPIFSFLLCISCQNEKPQQTSNFLRISGETMGTTYHITYEDEKKRNFKKEMDSILVQINLGASTYIQESDISQFNLNDSLQITVKDSIPHHFFKVYSGAEKVYKKTNGYFDPTVMPLVNYWGFGYTDKKPVTNIDKMKVESLKALVGMDKIIYGSYDWNGEYWMFHSTKPNIQLDFSAIAKGYAVDVLSEFFEEKKIKNYLVEVGGEVGAKGKNAKGKLWTTAISTPRINARLNEYEAIVKIDNKAIATSGNYRNFHEVNGEWYGHSINPKTGFPEKSNLLSVSVMANECMYADAYATAFMVMGLEKAKTLVNELVGIDAFFIFANEKGVLEYFYTKGFEGKTIR